MRPRARARAACQQWLASAQMSTPSVRRTQQLLTQSLFWLHSAAHEQLAPKHPQAVGFIRPVASWQQSLSPRHVCPTRAEQLAVLAHHSARSHTREPSVSDAQQALAQSAGAVHRAVQTVPRP